MWRVGGRRGQHREIEGDRQAVYRATAKPGVGTTGGSWRRLGKREVVVTEGARREIGASERQEGERKGESH